MRFCSEVETDEALDMFMSDGLLPLSLQLPAEDKTDSAGVSLKSELEKFGMPQMKHVQGVLEVCAK